MSPSAVVPGTLYADWLRRRESLATYRGAQEPIVATQLRVLDYLIDRYRDDAAALQLAPAPLDTVFLNQRAIVINHHRSLGLVAGVKSAEEAHNRVTSIVARMYDQSRTRHAGIDLDRAAVADDPWFGWEQPNERRVREYWSIGYINRMKWLRSRPQWIRNRMQVMPFLPAAFLAELYTDVADLDKQDGWSAELLACSRNRASVGYIANAWQMRIAAAVRDGVTDRLREALVTWDRFAADPVRCLLSDENSQVRVAAAALLAEIGELRDIGIFADLLAMPPLPDEEPDERLMLAQAMEHLATRLRKEAGTAD